MAQVKTNERTATAEAPAPNSPPDRASEQDIARRAYELYVARDCQHGHDVEDWLQAERELQGDPEC